MHIIFWSIYIVYEVLTIYLHFEVLDPLHDYLGHYILNISLFYCSALLVFPQGWDNRRSLLYLGISTLLAFAAYLALKAGLLHLFNLLHLSYYNPYTSTRSFLVLSFWRGLSFFTMGFFYWLITRYISKSDLVKGLKIQKFRDENTILKLELANLQAQVNPHFIYNTLSFIHNRALRRVEKLADIIVLLADIIEYSFKRTGTDGKVLLQAEIDQIKLYCSLNQQRTGQKYSLELSIKGGITDQRIPPMMLVAVTENLFKYGDLQNYEYPARIEINILGRNLIFHTFNRKNKMGAFKSSNLGLETLQKRLNFYYPDRFILEIDDTETSYSLHLEILL